MKTANDERASLVPHAYPFPTPLPVIAGAWKIRVFGQVGALPSGNDLCIQRMGDFASPTALAVATMVATHWGPLATACLATEYHGVSVGVYDLSTAAAPLVEVPMVAPGGVVGAPLPIASCGLIKHNVGIRKKVGKTFLSPVSVLDTDVANNNIADLARTRWQAGWDAFQTAVETDAVWGAGSGRLAVLSLITAKLYVPRTLLFQSSTVETKLASQNRRRLR